MLKFALACSAVFLTSCGLAQHQQSQTLLSETIHVPGDQISPNYSLNISDRRGGMLRIECATSASENRDTSGVFQCFLFDDQRAPGRNLLAPVDAVRSWDNRGRFLAKHLLPGCAEMPDWGARREFVVDGVRLEIALTNLSWVSTGEQQRIVAYDASIRVDAEPNWPSTELASSTETEPAWFFGSSECPAT